MYATILPTHLLIHLSHLFIHAPSFPVHPTKAAELRKRFSPVRKARRSAAEAEAKAWEKQQLQRLRDARRSNSEGILLQQPTPSSQQKQGQEEGGEGGKGGQKKKKKKNSATAAAASNNNNKLVPIKEDVAPSTTSRSTTPLVVPLNSPLSPRKASQVGQSFFAQDAWSDSASSDSEYQVI